MCFVKEKSSVNATAIDVHAYTVHDRLYKDGDIIEVHKNKKGEYYLGDPENGGYMVVMKVSVALLLASTLGLLIAADIIHISPKSTPGNTRK